jgi:hypothetical protein
MGKLAGMRDQFLGKQRSRQQVASDGVNVP